MGGLTNASVFYDDTDIPFAQNVLAIIPGSDPVLKNEYVVISAHNDHVGVSNPTPQGVSTAVDHDSLRAARLALLRLQMQGGELVANAPGTTVTVNLDSLRRIRPPKRLLRRAVRVELAGTERHGPPPQSGHAGHGCDR